MKDFLIQLIKELVTPVRTKKLVRFTPKKTYKEKSQVIVKIPTGECYLARGNKQYCQICQESSPKKRKTAYCCSLRLTPYALIFIE